MKNWIRRKIEQIVNIIKWLPILWKQHDYDYHYSLEVFKFQLEKQAIFLESNKACTKSAAFNAAKIRLALKLMTKVYNEDYALEYQEKLEICYGKLNFEIEWIKQKNNTYQMFHHYELNSSKRLIDEINLVKDSLIKKGIKKQKKAHRILWAFIEHNIQNWWD